MHAHDIDELKTVAISRGRAELERITQAIIFQLSDAPPSGLVDDIAARHLWDEYSWCLQDGLFLDLFEQVMGAHLESELEKAEKHTLICLSAYCREELAGRAPNDEGGLGAICPQDVEEIPESVTSIG